MRTGNFWWAAGRFVAVVAFISAAWIALFKTNDLLFSALAHTPRANWIFLPAGLRVLAVLLFGERAAVGLSVGAWFTLPHTEWDGLPLHACIAASSGIAPLLALWLCRRLTPIPHSLEGLGPRQILLLSLVAAFSNSVLLNTVLGLSGRLQGDVLQFITVLAGDMAGTAIVLMAISTTVNLAARRMLPD